MIGDPPDPRKPTPKTANRARHSVRGEYLPTEPAAVELLSDPVAETGCLGAVMIAPADQAAGLLSQLDADDFCDLRHPEILKGLKELARAGKPLTAPSVYEWAAAHGKVDDAGGVEFIGTLPDKCLSTGNWPVYLDALKDRSARRAAIRDCSELLRLARDPAIPATTIRRAVQRLLEVHAAANAGETSLTLRQPDEVLNMAFDDSDCWLGDRLLAAGQSLVIAGQGGVGKSRLALQLAVASILHRPFCGIETHAPHLRWLILQVENSNRRLRQDLEALRRWAGDAWSRVNDQLVIHTLEGEADSFVSVDCPENCMRLAETIRAANPDVVIWDSLYNFAAGDLNSDQDMAGVLQAISRLTRRGRPDRAPVVLHHALTGKAGIGRAIGFDRAGFARNSKVLLAWTRAQVNVAPADPEDTSQLVVACGKNSNGRPFPAFGVRLSAEMIYEPDPSFDLNAWETQLSGRAQSAPLMTPERVRELCKGPMTKPELARAIMTDCGCYRGSAYRYIARAEAARKIRFNAANELYTAR